jgi:hypothetical protein
MNNLSITGFRALMEWILELRRKHSETYQRVWFDTPVLRSPAWQSIELLSEPYAAMLENTADWMQTHETPDLHGFRDYEIQRVRRDIALMREAQKREHGAAPADFYRFFREHDRRRGTSFLKTFPEMRAFWQACEREARE